MIFWRLKVVYAIESVKPMCRLKCRRVPGSSSAETGWVKSAPEEMLDIRQRMHKSSVHQIRYFLPVPQMHIHGCGGFDMTDGNASSLRKQVMTTLASPWMPFR